MSQYTAPPAIPQYGLQPNRGTTVLVLGILSIVIHCAGIGIILGSIALVMGNNDLRAMAGGAMDRSGEGITRGGKICGIIGICLGSLSLVLSILYMLFAAALFATAASGAPHH
jgi:hypothetical protein